jgi:hypothetical protein
VSAARDVHLTSAELRLLAALCEPLLRGRDDEAVPATYRAIAVRPGCARPRGHRVPRLRRQLSEAGVPAAGREPDADVRGRLADWALRTGTVTPEHLVLLDT